MGPEGPSGTPPGGGGDQDRQYHAYIGDLGDPGVPGVPGGLGGPGGKARGSGGSGDGGRAGATQRKRARSLSWHFHVHSLRWRALPLLALLLIASVATFSATSGFLYLSAADRLVLRSELQSAPNTTVGIFVQPVAGSLAELSAVQGATQSLQAAEHGAHWFGTPIYTAEGTWTIPSHSKKSQGFNGNLESRTGVCQAVRVVAGHCPDAPGEVIASVRSADFAHWKIGQHLLLSLPAGSSPTVVISGLYEPDFGSAYWWGDNPFLYGTGGVGANEPVDNLFATQQTVISDIAAEKLYVAAQIPLDIGAVNTGNIAEIVDAIGSVSASVASGDQVTVSSGLASVAAAAASQEHQMATIIVVVGLELVLLSLIVLYGVVSRTTESREHDVAVAKLRGYPRLATAVVALSEPALVLVLAAPIGIALSFFVVSLAAPRLLGPGIPVTLTTLGVLAGLGAVAGGLIALALGSRQVLASRIGSRARSRGDQGGRVATLVADIAALTLAVAGVVELSVSGVLSGGKTDPLAMVAPALIAIGLAVVGARLLPIACRALIRPTRDSHHVALFLTLRQVVRRPALLRQIVVLAVAMGLACFAVAGYAVAHRNWSRRAELLSGADRVLTVQTRLGVDLVSAVRRADPSGRQAMAVESLDYGIATLAAVDSTRFASVAYWPKGLSNMSPQAVARYLDPPTNPPLLVKGSALRMTITLAHPVEPPTYLAVSLFDNTYQAPETVELGPMLAGTHTYTTSTEGDCGQSCRVTGLSPDWPSSNPKYQAASISMVLSGFEQYSGGHWSPVSPEFTNPGFWTVNPPGKLSDGRASAGVPALDYFVPESAASTAGSLSANDVPTYLPAVITPVPGAGGVPGTNPYATPASGLDGNNLNVSANITLPAIPGFGDHAVLVDLSLAERELTAAPVNAVQQVWLAPGADAARIIARLDAEGVTVTSSATEAGTLQAIDRSGVALSYALFLFAAIAAALLAAGTTVFTAFVNARRRSVEVAALEASGIRRRSTFLAMLGEQAMVIVSGLALGVLSGVLAGLLALPSVPEFSNVPPGPALDFSLPVVVLVALTAAAGLLLTVAASVSAATVVLPATPDLLRIEV